VRGRDQGKNIVETNVDAAWEAAKQMRLRDLGGLIVIDFIDMDSDEDKENVMREFKKAIRMDKAPVSFSNLSQFGLMEITRKRVRPNAVMERSNQCPACKGDGYIPTKESVVGSIDRWLRRFRAKKGAREIKLALSPEMIDHLTENRGAMVKYWERIHATKIHLLEDDDSHFAEFRIYSLGDEEITALAGVAA
jgi:ribonuclease G